MTIILIIVGIWLFFWFIGKVAEEMGTNRATSQISQNQHYHTYGQQSQTQGNAASSSSIEALFPFIDVYSYYALDDNRSWTSEKVRYIKHILSDDLTTEWNRALLKERLKLNHQRSLNELLHDLRCYLSRAFDDEQMAETKAVIMILCRMMNADGVSEQRIKDKARYIASFLGLPATELATIFNQLFPNAQQQQSSSQQRERNSQDSRNSNNNDQSNRNQNNSNQNHNKQNNGYQDNADHESNNSSYNNKNSNNAAYEWACSVLGLEPDNVTPESVQKAYRSKIKEYHPDKHQNLPESIQQLLHEKTQEVNEARDVLLLNKIKVFH